MAARAQQRGGVSAIHVWLIVFVALWLVSTVLLVWLYTDQATVTKQADDARSSASAAASKERNARQERDSLAELLTGAADDEVSTIDEQVTDLFDRIVEDDLVPSGSAYEDPTSGVVGAMGTLYESYTGQRDAQQAAEQRADELSDEVDRLTDEKMDREEAFAATEEQLTAQIRELEADRSAYRSQRDEEIDRVDERIEQTRQQMQSDIQNQRNENARLTQELDDLKSRYRDLQAKLGQLQIRPEELLTARQGDGHILTAKAGEDVVYIDLGRRDHLTRGMQFAVYTGAQGIPADGSAKARIEVARIFDETAECVVREIFGRAMILEGDIINNPVYDRTRTLKFVVDGRFDLDGDGLNEADGVGRIEALIGDWGGEVVDTVTARVDFVVLGDPPRRPSGDVDDLDDEAEVEAVRRQAYDAYRSTLQQATVLSVPVLTQEQFVHFLGYAGGRGLN